MDTSPNTPPEVPPGMSLLTLSVDEMDYLTSYWEIRDHGTLFAMAVKLLHDLTKADENGWRMQLAKAEVNEETKRVIQNPDYHTITFLLKWLVPSGDGCYMRIPVENLDALKVVKQEDAQ